MRFGSAATCLAYCSALENRLIRVNSHFLSLDIDFLDCLSS